MMKIDQQFLRKAAKFFGWAAIIMWPGASIAHSWLMASSPDYLANMLGYARFGEQFNTRPFLLNLPIPGVMCGIVWFLIRSGILIAKLRAKLAAS